MFIKPEPDFQMSSIEALGKQNGQFLGGSKLFEFRHYFNDF